MRKNPDYEIIEIADEYMAIPIGAASASMHGVIALSEATAFLLKNMKTSKSKDELITLLTNEYDVNYEIASKDIDRIINDLTDIGVVVE